MSVNQMLELHGNEWGIGLKEIYRLLQQTSKDLISKDRANELTNLNLKRLDSIYCTALEQGNLGAAMRALELEQKFIDKSSANVEIGKSEDGTINVKFGF